MHGLYGQKSASIWEGCGTTTLSEGEAVEMPRQHHHFVRLPACLREGELFVKETKVKENGATGQSNKRTLAHHMYCERISNVRLLHHEGGQACMHAEEGRAHGGTIGELPLPFTGMLP